MNCLICEKEIKHVQTNPYTQICSFCLEAVQPTREEVLSLQSLNLCYEIEKLPASKQQTEISITASNLHDLIKKEYVINMMFGKPIPIETTTIPPERPFGIIGKILNRILKFIHDHICSGVVYFNTEKKNANR